VSVDCSVQAEDGQDQHASKIILQHRYQSVQAVICLFNKVKNKCANIIKYGKFFVCHWHTIFIFNDIRNIVCCTSR